MKPFAVIAIAAAALVLTATSSTAGTNRHAAQPLGFIPHAAHATGFAPTVRTAKTAGGLNCVSACTAYESTINQYFTDVAAASAALATDNVYSVASQYSGIQYSETFGGSYVDGNPYPAKGACNDHLDKYCVTNGQLETEIGKAIAKNHWPTFSTSTLYFIFTPANVGVCIFSGSSGLNPCTTNVFCAYHSASAKGFIYAVEPDASGIGPSCDPGQAPAGNNADATINTISHEQNEAITDPFGDAWYSDDSASNNPENGDLCAYDFGTPLGIFGEQYDQVINGHDYLLQLEYSNAANGGTGGCVPSLGGTVTPNDPKYGAGPLVYHGGKVMTTNTVYAIYWVPAAPVNDAVPTISGTAKVGKTLKSKPGAWQNGPTYTYRWLRCSSAGASCKGITKATGVTYKLAKADKGHRIEVQVTGTNMIGHVTVSSAPTAAVKK